MPQDLSEQESPRYEVLDVAKHRGSSPNLIDTMLEGVRTVTEATTLGLMWGYLNRRAAHHQHRPHHKQSRTVMVLPGFMGGDASTLVLRRFLGDLGFSAHPWLLGTNDGTERL